jgi:hypothetical protein
MQIVLRIFLNVVFINPAFLTRSKRNNMTHARKTSVPPIIRESFTNFVVMSSKLFKHSPRLNFVCFGFSRPALDNKSV